MLMRVPLPLGLCTFSSADRGHPVLQATKPAGRRGVRSADPVVNDFNLETAVTDSGGHSDVASLGVLDDVG